MNDEKKDENPIDMSEVGPYCILLIDVGADEGPNEVYFSVFDTLQ